VVAFVEKPQTPVSNEALIGIYYVRELAVLRQSIDQLFADNIRGKGGEYYLTDALDIMLKGGGLFKTASVRHWLDCGTLEALMDTARHLMDAEADEKPLGALEQSVIIPPVYVGSGAQITDSVVGPYVCVEKDAKITRSVVRDSILFEGAQVNGAVLQDAFVGTCASISPSPIVANVGDFSEIQ